MLQLAYNVKTLGYDSLFYPRFLKLQTFSKYNTWEIHTLFSLTKFEKSLKYIIVNYKRLKLICFYAKQCCQKDNNKV